MEEEDYRSPPLAMERKAILDQYFDDIGVEKVKESQMGWEMINDKPPLWEQRREKGYLGSTLKN